MQSSLNASQFLEMNPEVQAIFQRVKQLQIEDEWIKDYYLSNPLPQQSQQPQYDTTSEYYQQFWKVYLTNQMVIMKIKQLAQINQELTNHLHNLQSLLLQTHQKPKKKRRISAEITKSYKCPYGGCQKAYGCDVSMNLHIKLKHNGGNKTQRQQMAVSVDILQKLICQAQFTGKEIPQVKIKFPPGYLQKYRSMYLSQVGN